MIAQPPTVAKSIRMGASDTRYTCTPWFVLCTQEHLPMRSSRAFFTLAMAAKMHFEGDIQTQATDQLVLAHIQQLVEDEGRLFEQGQHGSVGEMDRQRLAQVQLELDQCSGICPWRFTPRMNISHKNLPLLRTSAKVQLKFGADLSAPADRMAQNASSL